MLNYNRAIFTGNITRDPELKYTGSGTAVLSFSVAINNNYKNQSGEWVDDTCFMDVTVFSKFAESLNERIKKGSHVFIEGQLKQDNWDDKNTGAKRSKISVRADKVQLTQKQEKQTQYNSQPQNAAPNPIAQESPNVYQNEDSEDIPF